MKFKTLCVSMLAVLLFAGSAWPVVTINNKDIDTISDILREARAGGVVTAKDSNLEIEKDSIMRLQNGKLDLTYQIGSGDSTLSVGSIRDFSTGAARTQDNGFLAALAKTRFGSTKVIVTSSHTISSYTTSSTGFSLHGTNWFYDLYFVAVSNDNGVKQSRFGAWRYPMSDGGTTSGYIKDIKTGITVDGYDGELVVAATMEATNDNPTIPVNYNTKRVNARLDFWSLYSDENGNIMYKKLDSLTTKTGEMDSAPLVGIKAVSDKSWHSVNDMSSTTASPYMVIRCAAGDFNNDGYANEVAMITTNPNTIDVTVYQITYYKGDFSIKKLTTNNMGKRDSDPSLSNGGTNDTCIYQYNNPSYILNDRYYNGFNRAPGADIVAADVDGDGNTEIVTLWQGDFPANEREQRHYYHGANSKGLYCDIYKWNTSKANFDYKGYGAPAFDGYIGEYSTWLLWGGIKAAKADIDGDGKDEVVVAYLMAHIEDGDTSYNVLPRLVLYKMGSDGLLKPENDNPPRASLSLSPVITRKWGDLTGGEIIFAPVRETESYYPVVDRDLSLVAGPIFKEETTGIRAKEGIALRYYGGNMKFFKGNNGSLVEDGTLTVHGTTALVAADFAGEGLVLGKPTHFKQKEDISYTAILQAPPYHVDTLTEDGAEISSTPTNFSYVNGAATVYERKSSSTSQDLTKFNISSTVQTIFAIDSEATRSIAGAVGSVDKFYGRVKTVAGFIPGAEDAMKPVTGVVDTVFNFFNNFTDKITTIKEGFDKKISETRLQAEMKAERLDALYYISSTRNIWRYPIITTPAPVWPVNYTSVDNYAAKQDYAAFALSNSPIPNSTVDDPLYQPIHENGNLFSYPQAVANTERYSARQRDLTEAANAQFSTTTNGKAVEFLDSTEHEETTSKKVEAGFISQALSLIDSLFGSNIAKIPEPSTSPTYTRKEQKGEKISFILPNADSAPLNLGYTYQYQAYAGENGAVTTSFGVHSFNKDLNIFSSESLYSRKPDPALPLPYKFTVSNSSGKVPAFRGNRSRRQAMQMRGVRIYAVNYNRYTPPEFLVNELYRIDIPVYNASFLDAKNVRVDLYYVKNKEVSSLSGKQFIGTTYVDMTGWDEGSNKAWAHFTWKPTKIDDGNYELYAVIDPENNMDEVHENRSDTDPGGNNEGYFHVSIINAETAARISNIRTSGFRAAIGNDEIIFPTITYNDKATWYDFYNEYIASSDGPVQMTVTLTNKMDYIIPDTEIRLAYFEPELWSRDNEIATTDFVKKITLFPHETYTYEITIGDDIAEKLRKIGIDNTLCSYTCFWLDDLLEANAEAIPEGDPDPMLEVFIASGDVGYEDVTSGDVSGGAATVGSSGGGCDAGLGGIALLSLAAILLKRR